MNCHDTQTVWEEVRDGAASPQQREAFDDHLRCCGKCRSLWREETSWLEDLSRPMARSGADRRAFTQAAVAAWAGRRWLDVLARIGVPLSAVAAVLAIAVTLTIRMAGSQQGLPIAQVNPKEPSIPVRSKLEDKTVKGFGTQSLYAVAGRFEDVYYRKPAKVIGGIRRSIEQVNIKQLPDLLGFAMPEKPLAAAPSTRPAERWEPGGNDAADPAKVHQP